MFDIYIYINLLVLHTRGSYNSSCTIFLLLYEPYIRSVIEKLYATGSNPVFRHRNAHQEARFHTAQGSCTELQIPDFVHI
jgi:hypothetical protein